MRTKPSIAYSGLTIILSHPSRFDTHELLSGTAGHYFINECLHPTGISIRSCDIRTVDCGEEILANTKALLLLGDKAFQRGTDGVYKDYSLNEQRGSPLNTKWNRPVLCSYFPQDCIDVQDYESRLNPQAKKDGESEEYEREEDDDDVYATKKKGKTKRSNYRFWLRKDTEKIVKALRDPSCFDSRMPAESSFKIAPNSEDVISFLKGLKVGENLYVDIETSVDGGYNFWCIGFCSEDSPIYVVPIFRYNRTIYYSSICSILASFSSAMARCVTICHNGFAFDLLVLAWRLGIPFGRLNYDTMIALHRCFPTVEKSLGHGMSLFTNECYHKDEGIFAPMNAMQDNQLYRYNAKDVAGMRLLKQNIDAYAKTIPGLTASITQGNDCVYPYTLCSLSGINFDNDLRNAIISQNDRKMTQLLRMIDILKGAGYKDRLLPTSSVSCVRFFHDYLNYDVISRSKRISKKTGKQLNNPSLDEKNFWKLKLRHPNNILIDVCLKYRALQKETSMLAFEDWNIKRLPS